MTNTRIGLLPRLAHIPALALVASASLIAAGASDAGAQEALGVPFIGDNHLSFYSAELSRMGTGDAMTTVFGGTYARRFQLASPATRVVAGLRASARALDDSLAGVLDLAATVGLDHRIEAISGLSLALSSGVGTTIWGDDARQTGRIDANFPVTLGAGYDLHIRSATITPFVAPSVVYYQTRRYVDDVRVSTTDGWDAQAAAGVSVRFSELVMSTSRVYGEHGSARRSRWVFSAGMSF